MLISAIVSGAVAIYNQSKNIRHNKWIYVLVGITGIVVAIWDLSEVNSRTRKIQNSFGELSNMFGDSHSDGGSIMNFVGSGLYIVGSGSVVLYPPGQVGLLNLCLAAGLRYY
jgi:hypothetical protein